MTIFKFQGTAHREGGAQKYGELKINGAIQFIRGENGMSGGTIIFQDKSECGQFLDASLNAWRGSMQMGEPYLKTFIEPELGTPVYDIVGEELKHAVESEKLYKAYDLIGADSLPILPPYAKK